MQTLVVPALPFFVREFDTSAAWVTWPVTSFLVSSSVLTPILGKLGDAHGKKKLLAIFGSLRSPRWHRRRSRPGAGTPRAALAVPA